MQSSGKSYCILYIRYMQQIQDCIYRKLGIALYLSVEKLSDGIILG